VISLSGNFDCLCLSRISIFYFFYLAVFIISSLSVSFNLFSSINYYGLFITTFSLRFLSSFSDIIIASYCKPFSVFALISLNSIAEITPTSPFIGVKKLPSKFLRYLIKYFTYFRINSEFLIFKMLSKMLLKMFKKMLLKFNHFSYF